LHSAIIRGGLALQLLRGKLTNNIIPVRGEGDMSIKTTLTNPPTIALQITGGVLILASMVGFRIGGWLWPMIGSAAGTGLLILGWERSKDKFAAQKRRKELKSMR